MSRAILIVDHGSRRPEANADLERVASLREAADAVVKVSGGPLPRPAL